MAVISVSGAIWGYIGILAVAAGASMVVSAIAVRRLRTELLRRGSEVDDLREELNDAVQRLDECETSTAALATKVAAIQLIVDSVPGIGRAVAQAMSVIGELRQQREDYHRAFHELTTWQRNVEHRVEFARREIMFEMKYGSTIPAPDAVLVTEPTIIDTEKVARAQESTIRLNLGCGHIPLESHINVDMRNLDGVDIVADVNNLPFEPGTVGEIFSSHLIEHFPQEALRRQLLPYWRDLLRPGGRFHAIVPDLETMVNEAARGTYDFEEFREVLFGAQDYVGDFHYNALTPRSFKELLDEAGFTDVDVVSSGRRNGKCFEFEIVAFRPGEHEGDER